jgi:glycosyltransferase involved in cell wall biosynthesis
MSSRVDRVKVVRVIARLNIGGPAIHVINLTAGLDPTRFESMLVTGTESRGEGSMLDLARARGVTPVIIPGMVGEATLNQRDLKALLALYRLFRRERPHIVHTHTAKAGVLGRVAARLAGVPVVVHTYHGHVLHGYYSPLWNWLLRRAERGLGLLSDRLVTVSEQVKRDLVRYHVAGAEKITVIPLGLDLEPFLASAGLRGKLRRELGLSNGEPLVGIVGRIFPIKNHRLFLEAAARVAAELDSARLLVVGDGILRPAMEDYARALGIAHRVVFAGWRRDLPLIYPDLDVLVVSSNNEGTPVSAIEAMAAGCPVVATRVGGLPDLITDSETGCLVPPRDPAALAAGILRVLRDRETARGLGEAAQAVVAERFTVERLCRDVEGLYTELLARKGIATSSPVLEQAQTP